MPKVKVAVTGAAGQIGYALLPLIASGQMFGSNVQVELQLLELETQMTALEGVRMELIDGAYPLLKRVVCTPNVDVAMADANWVILVGAAPRTEGMERADLLRINGGIFEEQGKTINAYAASDVRVFVVGNPCNTNCLIAMHNAPNVSCDRFFAMTTLDENRARAQLAIKAGVDTSAVSNVTIWGNHSATQYPDPYHAKINGCPATEVIESSWLQNDFITTVQQRGAEIIKTRGASSALSAARAIAQGVYNLTHDTPEDQTYSMGLCSTGQYNVDKGLIFSYPCRTVGGKVVVVPDIIHDAFGNERIMKTHNELRKEKIAVES